MEAEVWDRVLKAMKQKVRQGLVVLTIHAEEEMDNDNLSLDDVLNGIVTGKIQGKQEDTITGGWKYRILGESLAGDAIEVVGKIGATGKVVIITVYRI